MIRIDCWGLDLTPYLQVGSLNINRSIGNRRAASLTLVADFSKMWIPQIGSDLKIYNDDTLLFGGVIREYQFKAPDEHRDTGRLFVTLSSDGYDSIAYRRIVGNSSWRNVKASYIVNTMCNPSVLGSDYVFAAHIEDGATIKEYSLIHRSVKDVLDDMANASGGKWYINDNKGLFFYINEPVTYGPSLDTISFSNVSVTQSLEDYVNVLYVLGGTRDDGTRLDTYLIDHAAIQARKNAEGGSGVYGQVIEDSNIVTDTDAMNLMTQTMNQYGAIPTTLEFDTLEAGFEPGQVLSVYLPRFGIQETMTFLVESVQITDININTIKYRVKAIRRKDVATAVNKMNQDYIEYMGKIVNGVKEVKEAQNAVGEAIVEYKRAIWETTTTFTFSKQYVTQPVVSVSLSFDYEGEPPTSGDIIGMYPKIELTTTEIDGVLYYTGVTVTWVGDVPPTLDNAYTNLVAIIGT